ncbi:MAG: LamG-like jellyroll fold domain-containing protein, partial [bacterium]
LYATIENNADDWAYIAGTLSTNVWTHVAFTFDNPSDVVRLFINGVQVGTGAALAKDMPDTDAPILIGKHYYTPAALDGLIDEIRIWNVARTPAQIQADMNRSLTGNEPGLIGYWRFDEGSGQTAGDSSGNGNHGRLGSTSSVDADDPSWVVSDAPVASEPFITVTSPNGGENWLVGSNHDIIWASETSITNVKIEYSTDSGSSWYIIVATTPNDGSYTWTIPNTPSSNCLVRISDAVDDDPSDVSNGPFSITVPPSITIISPNGGENWLVGNSYDITWSSQNFMGDVKIEYSTDGGSSWNTIAATTPNDGTYNWTVPDVSSSNCLVRVSDAADGDPSDTSDGTFAISSGATLQVLNKKGIPGSTGNLVDITLQNPQGVKGVQFMLTDTPDLLTATDVITTDRTTGFSAFFNEVDGVVRVILISTSGALIAPGTGPILQISYDVDAAAVSGDSTQLTLSKANISDENNLPLPVNLVNGFFYFDRHGDVDYDNDVDLFDVMRMIDIALGKGDPPTSDEMWAGDFDGDGDIDLFDILNAVDVILGGTPSPSLAKASEKHKKPPSKAEVRIPDLTVESGDNKIDLPVLVSFDNVLSGIQLTIQYDSGKLKLSEPIPTELISGMEIASNVLKDELRVIMFSPTGKTITPGEGTLLKIPVE